MKKMLNEDYKKIVDSKEKSPYIKNFILAYVTGGLICLLGQIIFNFCAGKGFDRDTSCAITSVSLIFLACLFTGLGLFDKAAKYAGAGTLVPITGFANSMVAPAMEFKSEGHIMGIGGKMFLIAGPVLVYGVTSSIVCGLIYYIFGGR